MSWYVTRYTSGYSEDKKISKTLSTGDTALWEGKERQHLVRTDTNQHIWAFVFAFYETKSLNCKIAKP